MYKIFAPFLHKQNVFFTVTELFNLLKIENVNDRFKFFYIVTEVALQITLDDILISLNSWQTRSPQLMIDIFEQVDEL